MSNITTHETAYELNDDEMAMITGGTYSPPTINVNITIHAPKIHVNVKPHIQFNIGLILAINNKVNAPLDLHINQGN